MKIEGHHLAGDRIAHQWSPNHSGVYAAGVPDTIILHYTACASAASAVRILTDTKRKVSAHLVVDRDGSITQLLPFDTIGWHAGRSRWGDRTEFNACSVGVEIDNAGRLHERDGRLFTWFEREIDSAEAVQGVHRNETETCWWHRFPDPQLAVVEKLCRLLVDTYPVGLILGHEEVAPQRKIDPGPAFPLDEIRQRVLPRSMPLAQDAAEDQQIMSGEGDTTS